MNPVERHAHFEMQRVSLQWLLAFAGTRSAPSADHGNTTRRDGLVRLKLYKGNIVVAGRKRPKSLYDPKIATMKADASVLDPGDETGFIRLNTLRLKLRAAMRN